jgi:hypothetical protein
VPEPLEPPTPRPGVVRRNRVQIGKWFGVTFERTLRVPDDGRAYPLPPSLGRFPVRAVAECAGAVPTAWRERGGVFLPMYQREALWMAFHGPWWHPCAVQVAVGGINAISGGDWGEGLTAEPQNYLVTPEQPWLDGINAGPGRIRQFLAVPLGMGATVEAQLTRQETVGGIQIRVYEPKPGRFPERPPPEPELDEERPLAAGVMGLGAGGQITQKIYPDAYGLDTWLPEPVGAVYVYIVNSEQYRALTGRRPPPTPVSAGAYTEWGFPWFALYDERKGTVPPSSRFTGVRSVGAVAAERAGAAPEAENSVEVPPSQVTRLRPPEAAP